MAEAKQWSIEWGGRTLTIETGKLALQTDASCTVRYGDTVILATVVKSKNIRDHIDYFPLMVDFEERLYAAGKIKGSRFIKREGRPSDDAILSGRLIDRSIRPLFDDTIRNDVQVVVTALAVDGENDAAIVALIAASCAVAISPIPWHGPIAAARVGRKDGKLILNATIPEIEAGDLDLVVAGTPEKLVMVESAAKEVPEEEILAAMQWGCKELEPVVSLITKIQKDLGVVKQAAPALADDLPDVADTVEEQVRQTVKGYVAAHVDDMIFDRPKLSRRERHTMLDALEAGAKALLVEKGIEEAAHKAGLKNIKLYVEEHITKRILDKEQRLDGRKITEIRPLTIAVDLLPRVHGSAMFQRGDTQVLSSVTLGAPGDVQTLDSMEEDGKKRYMHHYNDAPFTYGEAG
ncbi:MAG: polyribonucleotide nucleotidyltransferase, partial [Patescibacteria group bacterium]